jgi:hypothetical protein
MGRITFQQGVALAMGAYIDPANTANSKTFTLVCEGADIGLNVVDRYGNSVFGRAATNNNPVTNRLRALFHAISLPENQTGALDFAALPIPGLGTSGNMSEQAFTLYRSTTTGEPTGTSFRVGGDVDGNNTFSQTEKNLHRTGLSIWNKLKK